MGRTSAAKDGKETKRGEKNAMDSILGQTTKLD